MEKYPKRTKEHVKETKAMSILKSQIPSQWIIRETTERDYGIDCYIEPVTKEGYVMGELLAAQLKGTSNIDWKKKEDGDEEAVFSGIKISTINYWMKHPIPVYLFVADLNDKKIYYASIKQQIRNQYQKYLKQESVSFKLSKMLNLGTKEGLGIFAVFQFIEKNHFTFVSALRTLFVHWENYLQFIQWRQGLDCFLEAEPNEELLFVHIYQTLQTLSCLLDIDWNIESLGDIIKKDREKWGESCFSAFHYQTFTEILPAIESMFFMVIQKARERITKIEKEYWENKEIIIFRMANDLEYLKPGYKTY